MATNSQYPGGMRVWLSGAVPVDASLPQKEAMRTLRVDEMTAPGTYALDNAENIEALIRLGKDAGSRIKDQVESRSLNGIEVLNWKDAVKAG
jgi:hypothetical protein